MAGLLENANLMAYMTAACIVVAGSVMIAYGVSQYPSIADRDDFITAQFENNDNARTLSITAAAFLLGAGVFYHFYIRATE
jgi:hypothetical protein